MSAIPHSSQATEELSERDAAILAFERGWWAAASSKEAEIRERFGISSATYHQILNGLLDNPAALRHDPMLVKRLRRLREGRQRARSASRLVHHG